MATNLTALRTRVALILWDTANEHIPTAAIDEAIRLALGEYNYSLANLEQIPVTLADLDGAAASTLTGEHESLIALGAAGFAALGRGLDRAEAYDLNEKVPDALLNWGKEQLVQYRKMLTALRTDLKDDAEKARKNELRTTPLPPWGDGWRFDSQDGEEAAL